MAHVHETLESLAAKVAQLTWSITSYLNSEGLPQPSFAVDGPAAYPATPELTASRMMLIQSLTDMLHLARGGRDFIFTQSIGVRCQPLPRKAIPKIPWIKTSARERLTVTRGTSCSTI